MKHNENKLEEMVRDFTQVTPRPKSEVRSRLQEYAEHMVQVERERIMDRHKKAMDNGEFYAICSNESTLTHYLLNLINKDYE